MAKKVEVWKSEDGVVFDSIFGCQQYEKMLSPLRDLHFGFDEDSHEWIKDNITVGLDYSIKYVSYDNDPDFSSDTIISYEEKGLNWSYSRGIEKITPKKKMQNLNELLDMIKIMEDLCLY